MARPSKSKVDRRGFLKGAGAAGAAALTVPRAAVGGARRHPRPRTAATPPSPEQASQRLAAETAPLGDEANPLTVADPGSDFMVDVLKTLGLRVHRLQPGVELPRAPRIVHQLRRQQSARVADVLSRAGVGEHRERLLRGGRQADGGHHVRAVGPAPRDDGDLRRVLGAHADLSSCARTSSTGRSGGRSTTGVRIRVQDPADMVRDMVKWDDTPGSLQHFAESAVRAYKMAMTEPRGPVDARRRRDAAGESRSPTDRSSTFRS